jgi:hypothetical protein
MLKLLQLLKVDPFTQGFQAAQFASVVAQVALVGRVASMAQFALVI